MLNGPWLKYYFIGNFDLQLFSTFMIDLIEGFENFALVKHSFLQLFEWHEQY